MDIVWEIDDGYTGESRPQHTTIPDEELDNNCETEQDRDIFIDEWIQEEFEQNVSWNIISKD